MPTDHELVRVALGGQVAAVEELLGRHDPALRREARSQVWRRFDGAVEVDDVMQDFYEKVCRHGFRALAQWHGLTDPAHETIEPYLKAILRNVVEDVSRRRQAERRRRVELPDGEIEEVDDPSPGHDETLAGEEERAALQDCIRSALSQAQRSVVEGCLLGRSHSEIAESLGITPGNARVLLHRGLQALRTCLEARAGNGAPVRRVTE